MRRSLILLTFLLLAACAGDAPTPPPVATADFIAPGRIEVRTRASRLLDDAELIAPDGRGFTAETIQSDRLSTRPPVFGRPAFGVNVEGASGSGVNPGLSMGLPVNGLFGAPRRASLIESSAVIVLPDMTAYRRGWQDWTIKLRFGRPDQKPEYLDVPAPSPSAVP